jgi:adenylate cyclase class IV
MRDYQQTIRTKEQLRANCKDLRERFKQLAYDAALELVKARTQYYNENFLIEGEPPMTISEMTELINEKVACITNAEQAVQMMQVCGKARIERNRAKLIERNTIR